MADKKQDQWTEQDQQKAAERGQGAEIGATHGTGQSGKKQDQDQSRNKDREGGKR